MEILVNGNLVRAEVLADVSALAILGSGDGDAVILDNVLAFPVTMDGGLGWDSLAVLGDHSAEATYTPSATVPGSGTVSLGANELGFVNLEPLTIGAVPLFTLMTAGSQDRVRVQSGGLPGELLASGTSDGVRFESVTLSDVGVFVIDTGTNDAALPDDIVTLEAPLAPTGLSAFQFAGGAGADRLVYNGTALNDLFAVDSAGQVSLSNASHVHMAVAAASDFEELVLNGLDGEDTFELRAAPFQIEVHGGDPSQGGDVLSLVDPGETRTVTIAPEADAARQEITGAGAHAIRVSGVELVTCAGTDGDDTLVVAPGPGDDSVRVQGAADAPPGDVVLASSLPAIRFSDLSVFRLDLRASGGLDVATFATGNLHGADPAHYQFSATPGTVLVVEGDDAGAATYTLANPGGGTTLRVTDGTSGVVLSDSADPDDAPGRIEIYTLGGDDILTVDVDSSPLIAVPILYDGGSGRDSLIVTGAPADAVNSVTYSPGPAVNEGRLRYDAATTDDMLIEFRRLEPVWDLVVAAALVVNGTGGPNEITYTAELDASGSPIADRGQVSVDEFESIAFASKANLTINGWSGNDTVVLDNGDLPAGLTTITVHGGEGDDCIAFLSLPDASGTPFGTAAANGNVGNDRIDARLVTVNTPITLQGNDGDDWLAGGSGDDVLNGGEGDDTLVESPAADTYDGGEGFDTLAIEGTPRNDLIDVLQNAPSSAPADNYQITIGGAPDFVTKTAPALAPSDAANAPTVEEVRIEAKAGNDTVRVAHADEFTDGDDANGAPQHMLRFTVVGDAPHASDRLIVRDVGVGDLVLVRQSSDGRSGRVTVAPAVNPGPGEVIYEGFERLDVLPINPVTGGTGDDGAGRLVLFRADPLELNDHRLMAADLELGTTVRGPNIDPGGTADLFGAGDGAPGDEDWYEFRPARTSTFRLEVPFPEIATVPSGRPGLPANGDLDIALYDSAGVLIAAGVPGPTGESLDFTGAANASYFLRVKGSPLASLTSEAINTYKVRLNDVDAVGPQVVDPDGAGPLSGVHITENPATPGHEAEYDLLGLKGSTSGPTPPVPSLTIHFRDLPAPRAPGSVYAALDPQSAGDAANYRLVGDQNGIIAIAAVTVINDALTGSVSNPGGTATAGRFQAAAGLPPSALSTEDDFYSGSILRFTSGNLAGQQQAITSYDAGTLTFETAAFTAPPDDGSHFEILQAATGRVMLDFAEPLPDDRFTLTIFDRLLDPAGNRLDGESNAVQPLGAPAFPSGDGIAGGDFQARFTVDSRAEIGCWSAGSVYLDANGNFRFDPDNADLTNRDLVFTLGRATDFVFAGDFNGDGYDELAAYHRNADRTFSWLIANAAGATVAYPANGFQIGMPLAGNFDGDLTNGDEVGVFTGSAWLYDTNHDYSADLGPIRSGILGLPVVGNFDGLGGDDVGTYDPVSNRFFLSLDSRGGGFAHPVPTNVFTIGSGQPFIGVRERPVAGDMDGDGIDDIGLWVPDRSGVTPTQAAEWYFLISHGRSIADRIAVEQVQFTPYPFGWDLFAQFGDQFAIPVVGNFDPPLAGQSSSAPAAAPTPAAPPATQVATAQAPPARQAVPGAASITVDPIPNVTVLEDAGVQVVNLASHFRHSRGETLAFSIASNTNSALVTPVVKGDTIRLRLAANQHGTSRITVQARDASGTSAQLTFQVVVQPVNDPPVVVRPLPDVTVLQAAGAQVVDLSPVFTDGDGDQLQYTASTSPGAAMVCATVSGSRLTLAFVPGQHGTGQITVRASDPAGAFAEDVFQVVVQPAAASLVTPPAAASASSGEAAATKPAARPPDATLADGKARIGLRTAEAVVTDTNGDTVLKAGSPSGGDAALPPFGLRSDYVIAGSFAESAGGAPGGLDTLVAYGSSGNAFRWLVDFSGDGVADRTYTEASGFAGRGVPVIGNFDGRGENGDEVGLFTGSQWYFDTDHDFQLSDERAVGSDLVGRPAVGDFDGDGVDDVATWNANYRRFELSLSSGRHGGVAAALARGRVVQTHILPGNTELFGNSAGARLLAADMDGDGFDALGLWSSLPGSKHTAPASCWCFVMSAGRSIAERMAESPTRQVIPSRCVTTAAGDPIVGRFATLDAVPAPGAAASLLAAAPSPSASETAAPAARVADPDQLASGAELGAAGAAIPAAVWLLLSEGSTKRAARELQRFQGISARAAARLLRRAVPRNASSVRQEILWGMSLWALAMGAAGLLIGRL